jgi:glycolate oxidase
LEREVGPEVVSTDPVGRQLLRRDASTFDGTPPAVVCLPRSSADVQAIVRYCARTDRAFVTRGSGTGLAGGATPVDDTTVVISTTRMTDVISVDVEDRVAWVQPGVLNLDLSNQLGPVGFRFSPDPSSQAACTIGGNVANNSGGPHCLAEGVTSAHVVALDVVLPDGELVRLGSAAPDETGLDLRGAFVGSEGTMGVATAICVRLTELPPDVRTMLAVFEDLDGAAAAVSAVIADGIVPAALEMIDGPLAAVLEDFVGAGLPRDAAAVLLVELEGLESVLDRVQSDVAVVLVRHGATDVRVAVDEAERGLWWKARKSAFGAIARIKPDYYLHDTVVPRNRLVGVLREVREIAARHQIDVYNVFHAGDGNLHPLLLFDRRDPGIMERVHAAGREIVEVSLAAGGVLSGEHGIGLEKREFMALMFSDDDLAAQACLRSAFDPDGRANPHKVLPAGSRCGDVMSAPEGTWI